MNTELSIVSRFYPESKFMKVHFVEVSGHNHEISIIGFGFLQNLLMNKLEFSAMIDI